MAEVLCMAEGGDCAILPASRLKGALEAARQGFLTVDDATTMAALCLDGIALRELLAPEL